MANDVLEDPYLGVEQPDVAALTVASGAFYRCYVYKNNRDNSIDAVCFVELEHGQDVQLFCNHVRLASIPATDILDCPKIVAWNNTHFIVHWLEGPSDNDPSLHRAYIDMTDIATTPTWTYVGSIATHVAGLYDVQEVQDVVSSFMLVHKVDAININVRRCNGTAFATTVWNQNYGVTIADRCIGVYAHALDADVLVGYQGTGGTANTLVVTAASYTTGLPGTATSMFPANGAAQHAAVGFCRYTTNQAVVVADALLDSIPNEPGYRASIHLVSYQKINTATGALVDNEQRIFNFGMMSNPFCYANGEGFTGATSNIYCFLTFKEVFAPGDWFQSYVFVANLQVEKWDEPANTVRAIPMANFTNGDQDGRQIGLSPWNGTSSYIDAGVNVGRRMNHISHVSKGPPTGVDINSRTAAAITWSEFLPEVFTSGVFGDVRPEDEPVGAIVTGLRYYPEEPWMFPRDSSSPALPAENFKGAYPYSHFQTMPAGESMFISGATPTMYDGQQVVELQYTVRPEIIDSTPFPGAGANILAGKRFYRVTAEWRDHQGALHRIASRPFEVDTAALDSHSFDVRTLTLSFKEQAIHYPNHQKIQLVLWRTATGLEAPYFRVWGTGGPSYSLEQTPVNDPSTYLVTMVDIVNEDFLVQSQQLDLNTLNNTIPVALGAPVAFWKNRIFATPTEGRTNVILYTNEILPVGTRYLAPEFTVFGEFRIDQLGVVMAMQPMDDQLVVFTRDAIYSIKGEGADLAGGNASLTLEVLAEGTGCIEPRSIVLGPPGVFFQSAKGYYLINRGGQLDYTTAGSPVEDDIRNAGNVRAATLMETEHQIRIVINANAQGSDTEVLVYDYLHKLWSKAVLPAIGAGLGARAADGIAWRGASGETLHVVLPQGSAVAIQRPADDPNLYDEQDADTLSTVPVAIDILTHPIHTNGIAGFKRIYEIGIQTEKPNSSPLRARVQYDITGEYDFTTTPEQVVTWSAANITGYGRIRPNVQKVSAIRVGIDEDPATIVSGANVTVTSLTLLVGHKPKPRRVPDRTIGV